MMNSSTSSSNCQPLAASSLNSLPHVMTGDGEDVVTGDGRAVHCQRGMQDLVAPFGGRLAGHRRVELSDAEVEAVVEQAVQEFRTRS